MPQRLIRSSRVIGSGGVDLTSDAFRNSLTGWYFMMASKLPCSNGGNPANHEIGAAGTLEARVSRQPKPEK
jgi:hypothetical protein